MSYPYNFPNGNQTNISFGPAVVALMPHATGGTPGIGTSSSALQESVGFIGEDGVSIELQSEKKTITQGNPRLPMYVFTQAQNAMISFTSIEWEFDNWQWALGGGTADTSSNPQTFVFGGSPKPDILKMYIEHDMGVQGTTLGIYVWKCVSDAGFNIPLGQDEHQFEFKFKALRAESDWAGTALTGKSALIKFERNT